MGNTRSAFFEQVEVDPWWDNDRASRTRTQSAQTKQTESQTTTNANQANAMEVNQEISALHAKRIKLIAEKKKEFDDLRREVAEQKQENEELKELLKQAGAGVIVQKWDSSKVDVSQQTDAFEVPGQSECHDLKAKVEELHLELSNAEAVRQKNRDLQINMAELQSQLQKVNSELAAFETERQEYKTHVIALKDIIAVSKQLLLMRESQIKELTQKVAEIQASLAEKDLVSLSEDLRAEYERQLRNIKQLKALYEQRQQADKTEMDNLKSQLDDAKNALKVQEATNSELQARVDELEKDNVEKSGTIITLESQLGFTKAECGELRAEMTVINQLFSQILLGFNNGQEINLDKLIKTLEENHDLLTDIVVNEECTEISSALPKVLLDLVTQVNDKAKTTTSISQEEPNQSNDTTLTTISEESESQASSQQSSLSSASEIVQNLPKVWRVLTELLSHQVAPVSVLNENPEQSDTNPCYKSVQTPTGPTMVLSVSKTFIRLKNLILEKKSLEKDTTRLKQLNTHLETRLQDQEKRLEMVSHELSKTWNVVGKMQKQHQQLHTQEKILRYELAQKRKLLNELKEELEYCREKWLQAREKNSTTEEQWKQLRTEFASRKTTISEDLNNSVESGYSDDRESSSSEEDDVAEYESEPSVPSPETVPGCSNVSEQLENASECQEDTGSVETVINMVTRESEQNSGTILKVIQDEIAKIENVDASGEASSSAAEGVVQNAVGCSLAQSTSEEEATATEAQSSPCQNTASPLLQSPTPETTDMQNQFSLGHQEIIANNEIETEDASENTNTTMETTSEDEPAECSASSQQSAEELREVPNGDGGTEAVHEEKINNETECGAPSTETTKESEPTSPQPAEECQEPALNGDGSAEEVHSEETLKTDLVQNEGEEVQKTSRTPQEILAAREERLKRLEQEAKDLVAQTTNTSNRSIEICTKLEDLHEQYGSDPRTRRRDIDDMYKKLEEDILQTIKKTQGEEFPSTSKQNRSTEEILAAREERLKRLEEESNQLVNRATRTSHRSTAISSKLDDLHQQYGESSKQRKQNEETDKSLEESTSVIDLDVDNTLKFKEENTEDEERPSTSKQSRPTEENATGKNNQQGEETDTASANNCGSSSNSEASTSSSRSPEEILARREERLQRMEQEARELMGKALRNSFRGLQFCSKLNRLHDRYGTSSDSSDEGADDNNNTADAPDVPNGAEARGEDNSENGDSTNTNQGEDSQREEQS